MCSVGLLNRDQVSGSIWLTQPEASCYPVRGLALILPPVLHPQPLPCDVPGPLNQKAGSVPLLRESEFCHVTFFDQWEVSRGLKKSWFCFSPAPSQLPGEEDARTSWLESEQRGAQMSHLAMLIRQQPANPAKRQSPATITNLQIHYDK